MQLKGQRTEKSRDHLLARAALRETQQPARGHWKEAAGNYTLHKDAETRNHRPGTQQAGTEDVGDC